MQVKNRVGVMETKDDANGVEEQTDTRRTLGHAWAIMKKNIRMEFLRYSIEKHDKYDPVQTQVLITEMLSRKLDSFFIVRALEGGADPNAIIGKGIERALHRAARKGSVRVVQYLVQAGADINALNGRHQTPLIVATDSKRTDKEYIDVIRYLANHKDSKLETADVGSNTALLNGIFSNNVWITRVLLLAGAKVTRADRGPYDVALFILAEHIHLDVKYLPDRLIHPWRHSVANALLSPKGSYSYAWLTLLQTATNSDIELIFKMVQHRLLELESAGVDTSAPAKSRRKPEEKEEEPQETDEARRIREELERREQQRAERDIRRREGKRLKREAADKARWEGVIAGIEHKVNSKYGYKPSPATETEQVWAPDSFDETPSDDKTNITVGSNGSSGSMFPGSTRGGSTAGKGIGSTRGDRGSVNLTLRSTGESLASQWDDSSTGESSHASGKRWKVAEKKNKAIYSLNPGPGLGTVSAETPSDPVTSTSKATAISRRRGSENW